MDIVRVGEELRVATVLEGSVQRSGERLRIIAQLIDTATGGHIWSETFDRSGDDIFAIHDEIADAVVENLAISLTPEERERLQSTGTDSVEAYTRLNEIAERAASIERFDIPSEQLKAQQYLLVEEARRVLEIDPDYAAVYTFIASVYDGLLFGPRFSSADDAYHLREGYAALYQALVLAPEDPRALVLLASLSRRERNYAQAEAFARMAYARAPNSVSAAIQMSLVLVNQSKNPAEALEFVELEEALDPNQPLTYRRKMFALATLGRHEEALAVARAALEENPRNPLAAPDVADRLSILGRHAEAFAGLIDFRTREEDNVGDPVNAAWLERSTDLGLVEEIEKIAPRLNSEELRALAAGSALARSGRVQDANEWLRSYLEQAAADIPPIHDALARNCLRLREYACAVAERLISSPHLDSRDGRVPGIVTTSDFEEAVHLAHAFRQAGEIDAAARQLRAATRWYDTRAVDGYVAIGDYFLPELFVLLGEDDRAIAEIRERVMLDDDDFIAHCPGCSFETSIYDSLRGNAEFEALVDEYERRKAVAVGEIRELIEVEGF